MNSIRKQIHRDIIIHSYGSGFQDFEFLDSLSLKSYSTVCAVMNKYDLRHSLASFPQVVLISRECKGLVAAVQRDKKQSAILRLVCFSCVCILASKKLMKATCISLLILIGTEIHRWPRQLYKEYTTKNWLFLRR